MNPITRPAASSSTTPPADGCSEWNTVRVAIAPFLRCSSMSERISKSVRLSALQARNISSPSTHCRLATSVPALPSNSGSKKVRDHWRRGTRGDMAAYHIRQVMEVDENFVDACTAERVEPDVEQRPTVDGQHAFRDRVGDRPEAGCQLPPRAGRPSVPRPPDHSEGAHPCVRLGQHPVEAVYAVKPGGIGRD